MKPKLKKIEQEIIRDELTKFYWQQLEKLTGMNVSLTGTLKYQKPKKQNAKPIRGRKK